MPSSAEDLLKALFTEPELDTGDDEELGADEEIPGDLGDLLAQALNTEELSAGEEPPAEESAE